ncbi:MAG: hypothetical protein KDD99_25590, partial [Bacteroidetes bacterium]|nr:hypothetical protein [Bacteroidota bacterium]
RTPSHRHRPLGEVGSRRPSHLADPYLAFNGLSSEKYFLSRGINQMSPNGLALRESLLEGMWVV